MNSSEKKFKKPINIKEPILNTSSLRSGHMVFFDFIVIFFNFHKNKLFNIFYALINGVILFRFMSHFCVRNFACDRGPYDCERDLPSHVRETLRNLSIAYATPQSRPHVSKSLPREVFITQGVNIEDRPRTRFP